MRRSSARAAVSGALLLFGLVVVLGLDGCKKKNRGPIEIEAGPPPEEASADLDAKETVKIVVSIYPAACDANAATRAWAACRDASGGYGKVYSCAEKGLREARAALSSLPPSAPRRSICADEIEKRTVAMMNAVPQFFTDITHWLHENHDALAPALLKMPLGEACRENRELCTREPHDYDDAYKAIRLHDIDTIECTTKLFRCGQKDSMDCWLGNVVPRLGVACDGAGNRSGATPDDLLYVRETGTPIAR